MIEVSIIMPVYNVERYLKKCLDSIYKINLLNKEIILINDGSTDNSLEILKEYKNKYFKETTLISQANKGLSEARNIGIKNSSGEYLLFIDSDDFVDSDALEKFLKEGLDCKSDILIGNHYDYYNENEIIKNKDLSNFYTIISDSGKKYFEETIKNKCFYPMVWKNLYRKDFILKNNLFFKPGIYHEDNLFIQKGFYLAEKIKISSQYFYFYRKNNNTSITKLKSQKKYRDLLIIIKELLEFSKKNKISDAYYNRVIVSMYLSVSKEGKIKNNKVFKEIIKLKLNFREKLKIILISLLSFRCKEYENIF